MLIMHERVTIRVRLFCAHQKRADLLELLLMQILRATNEAAFAQTWLEDGHQSDGTADKFVPSNTSCPPDRLKGNSIATDTALLVPSMNIRG